MVLTVLSAHHCYYRVDGDDGGPERLAPFYTAAPPEVLAQRLADDWRETVHLVYSDNEGPDASIAFVPQSKHVAHWPLEES
jgi:hypothetical protein